MITLIAILLILITVLLILSMLSLYFMWRKLSVYLTYNTRYQAVEYEKAVNTTKFPRPKMPAIKTEVRGRAIKPSDDLVDLEDMDFEDAAKIVEELGA